MACSSGDDCSGQSFVDALKNKFDEDDTPAFQNIILRTVASRKTKSGTLVIPERLSLSYSSITHSGQMSDVTHLLRNVSELDLSINHLTQWHEVFSILLHLPNIYFLDLSRNPLYQSHDLSLDLQLDNLKDATSSDGHTSFANEPRSVRTLKAFKENQKSVIETQLCLESGVDLSTLDALESAEKSIVSTSGAIEFNGEPNGNDSISLDVQSNTTEQCEPQHNSTSSPVLVEVAPTIESVSDLQSIATPLTSGALKNETAPPATSSSDNEMSISVPEIPSDYNQSLMALEKSQNISASDPLHNIPILPETPNITLTGSHYCEIAKSDIADHSTEVVSRLHDAIELKDEDSRETELINDMKHSSIISFSNITQLVLNATKLTWATVQHILPVMPELKELHLSFNEYYTVDIVTAVTYPKITDVHFNGNNVSSWSEMKNLGRLFPGLEKLIMMDNPLTGFSPEEPGAEFKHLKALCLTRTLIPSWVELERLKHFPGLTDVKILGIPFFQDLDEKLRRKLVIGYLPNISRLNGSSVSVSEREEAERAFIRHYMSRQEKPDRYVELELKHGKLAPLANINLGASDYVTVNVQFENKSVLKQLNLHLTAIELKRMLARELVFASPQKFTMYHQGSEVMTYMQRTLLTYRVMDGDEIVCCLKEPKDNTPPQ